MVDILNLNNQQNQAVEVTVEREAGFNNTVDFYEVEADGSVLDPASGEAIALGEPGYAEAAIANRLGLDLTTENGETTEYTVDFEEGTRYAPVIAVDSDFQAFEDDDPSNDPVVYFSDAAANDDQFDHVNALDENQFSFEDLPNGGDEDFNDIVVTFSPDDAQQPDGVIQGQNLVIDDAGTVGSVDLATGELTGIFDSGIELTDIDIDPEGNVFGISASGLYSIDLQAKTATLIGSYGVDGLNALEIGDDGTLYATSFSSQELYVLDPSNGAARSIGVLPEGVNSAGDLQFANNTLYLAELDDLVGINVEGDTVSDATVIGSFNLEDERILGITLDEDGDPVGLTDNGSILELDLDTGEASQVGTVEDNTTIFGAAALPDGFFEDNPSPVDPVDPADPTDPVDPADPVNPVDPVDPIGQGTISGVKFDDLNGNGVRDTEIVQGENPDVVFVIDESGSTNDFKFEGTDVGDLNGDGVENDVIDAEIAGFIGLNQQLIDQGLGDSVDVGIVAFSGGSQQLDLDPATSGVQLTTTPNADNDNNGIPDVVDALSTLTSDGGTDFEAGLQGAEEIFDSLETQPGDGNLIFISDGVPDGSGIFADEVERLNNRGVNISAFGAGNGATLNDLQVIDPDAQIFTSTDQILSVFAGLDSDADGDGETDGGGSQSTLEPGIEGVNIYLDLNGNEVLDANEPTQVTNANGEYSFTDLEAGTYTVREVIPSGSSQTAPTEGQFVVELGAGEIVEELDFGNVADSSAI